MLSRLDHEGHAWKISFRTEMSGDLPTAWKKTPSWPIISDLRQDPYEHIPPAQVDDVRQVGGRCACSSWYPAQQLVGSYLGSLKEFPPARGSSLSLGETMDADSVRSTGSVNANFCIKISRNQYQKPASAGFFLICFMVCE